MKSPLHKKKRSLNTDIKIQHAAVAKKDRLASKPSQSSSLVTDNSIVSSMVAMPTPMRLKVNNRFYKVASARLNLPFWSYYSSKEVYTNMIPHILTEINGNLSSKYKRRITSNRRSLRHQCTR